MQEWACLRQHNAGCSGHRVLLELGFSVLEGPRQVLDIAAVDVIVMTCIEAIASGQEVGERSFFRKGSRGERTITRAEFGRPATTPRKIANGSVLVDRSHRS